MKTVHMSPDIMSFKTSSNFFGIMFLSMEHESVQTKQKENYYEKTQYSVNL